MRRIISAPRRKYPWGADFYLMRIAG